MWDSLLIVDISVYKQSKLYYSLNYLFLFYLIFSIDCFWKECIFTIDCCENLTLSVYLLLFGKIKIANKWNMQEIPFILTEWQELNSLLYAPLNATKRVQVYNITIQILE